MRLATASRSCAFMAAVSRSTTSVIRPSPRWRPRPWPWCLPLAASGGQALNGASGDGLDELGVVPFVLVGVQIGEPPDLGGEPASLPDVAVDGYRVAGAGVSAGEPHPTRGSALGQAGGDQPTGSAD